MVEIPAGKRSSSHSSELEYYYSTCMYFHPSDNTLAASPLHPPLTDVRHSSNPGHVFRSSAYLEQIRGFSHRLQNGTSCFR